MKKFFCSMLLFFLCFHGIAFAEQWLLVTNENAIKTLKIEGDAITRTGGLFSNYLGHGMAVTPDGSYLLASIGDAPLSLVDISDPVSPRIARTIPFADFWPAIIQVTPDGRYAILCDELGLQWAAFNLETFTHTGTFNLQENISYISSVAVSANNILIMCDPWGQQVIYGVFDPEAGLTGEKTVLLDYFPQQVVIAPDGKTVLVAGWSTITSFEITDQGELKQVDSMVSGNAGIQDIIFSADGSRSYYNSVDSSPDSLSWLALGADSSITDSHGGFADLLSDVSCVFTDTKTLALAADGANLFAVNPCTEGQYSDEIVRIALASGTRTAINPHMEAAINIFSFESEDSSGSGSGGGSAGGGGHGTEYKLYYPHIASESPWETEIAMINPTSEEVHGELKAYDSQGTRIYLPVKAVTLSPHGRLEIDIAREFTNHAEIAYMTLGSSSSQVIGYTKFANAEAQYRVAVPAVKAKAVSTGIAYISHIASSEEWWTGIALLNTADESRYLAITFDNGVRKSVVLKAKEHKVFTIRNLFDDGKCHPEVNSAVIAGADGVIGLELFGSMNAATAHYLSGISITDRLTTTIYYPHVASDAVWWTGIVAYNPSSMLDHLTITAYNKEGESLAVINDSENFNSSSGKYVGLVANLGLPEGTAWVQIDADEGITGFELFGTKDQSLLAGYTGVDIATSKGIFPKIKDEGWTGIALINPGDETATVKLYARNDKGEIIEESRYFSIGKHEKIVTADLRNDFFQGHDIEAATYIDFISDIDLVGFQLNNAGKLLDALPASGHK